MSSASTSANACIDQTPTMKSPSFTDPYADAILLSCDGVEFKVYKGILVMVSPFFRDMFRLPQPAGGIKYEPGDEGSEESCTADVEASKSSSRSPSLPRIQVSEDSHTLDLLLCTIYPVPSPTIDMKTDEEASLANRVLAAAVKYDMELVKKQICATLIASSLASSKSFEPSSAVRIYAIACRHSMRDIARDAARASLHGSVIDEYFPELETITAGAYFRLQRYHKTVSTTILTLIDTLQGHGLPQNLSDTVTCRSCSSSWWTNWKSRAKEVVAKAPLSEEIFKSAFIVPALSLAGSCTSCRGSAHVMWQTAEKAMREGIEAASSAIKIDLTGI